MRHREELFTKNSRRALENRGVCDEPRCGVYNIIQHAQLEYLSTTDLSLPILLQQHRRNTPLHFGLLHIYETRGYASCGRASSHIQPSTQQHTTQNTRSAHHTTCAAKQPRSRSKAKQSSAAAIMICYFCLYIFIYRTRTRRIYTNRATCIITYKTHTHMHA